MQTDIKNRFTFHPATPEKAAVYEEIRGKALEYALWLDAALPESREKSLALTHLDSVVFNANASIARH